MTKTPEQILQEFHSRTRGMLKRMNMGKVCTNSQSTRGQYNIALDDSVKVLAEILEVCPICLGTGSVEIQTAPDDSHIRKCECQGEEDHHSDGE